MRAQPGLAIAFERDEVPSRGRQGVEVLEALAPRGHVHRAAALAAAGQAADLLDWSSAGTEQGANQFQERLLQFAQDHEVEPGVQVIRRAVGGVGAVDQSRNALVPGDAAESGRQPPVLGQTHLGQEVEIVLAHGDQAGAVPSERRAKPRFGGLEGAVEQGDVEAFAREQGGRDERLKRRVGLHLPDLLPVRVEVIGVGEKNIGQAVYLSRPPEGRGPSAENAARPATSSPRATTARPASRSAGAPSASAATAGARAATCARAA